MDADEMFSIGDDEVDASLRELLSRQEAPEAYVAQSKLSTDDAPLIPTSQAVASAYVPRDASRALGANELFEFLSGRRAADTREYDSRLSALREAETPATANDAALSGANNIAALWQDFSNNQDAAAAFRAQAKAQPFTQKLAGKRAELDAWYAKKQAETGADIGAMLKAKEDARKAEYNTVLMANAARAAETSKTKAANDAIRLQLEKRRLEQALKNPELSDREKIQLVHQLRMKEAQAADERAVRRDEIKLVQERAKEGEKRSYDLAELNVPGWKLKNPETIRPAKQEAEGFKKMVSSAAHLADMFGELRELYRQHGTEQVPGPVRTKMASLVRNLQMELKGPAAFQLGVLAGPDMQLLEDTTPDPTKRDLNSMLNWGALDKAWEVTENSVKGKVARYGETLGYEREGGRSSGPQQAPGSDSVTIRRKSDGATVLVPAAEAREFLKSPKYEVAR